MNNDIVTRLRQRALYRNNRIAQEIGLAYSDFIENEAADEIERLHKLLRLFDDYFICEECDKACATYLRGCENPLHLLHTAAWELEQA